MIVLSFRDSGERDAAAWWGEHLEEVESACRAAAMVAMSVMTTFRPDPKADTLEEVAGILFDLAFSAAESFFGGDRQFGFASTGSFSAVMNVDGNEILLNLYLELAIAGWWDSRWRLTPNASDQSPLPPARDQEAAATGAAGIAGGEVPP